MVQLSPSPTPDVTDTSALPAAGKEEGQVKAGGSPGGLLRLEVSTPYPEYETYIEDGLICLKHKVRNLEKKKLKLKDYRRRLSQGEVLNQDQMAAVEKYEEVLHNLEFARELHKTMDGLAQNLLKAQKEAVQKEQMARTEVERGHLSKVLQFHELLSGLQQEYVQKDLLAGCNHAPRIPAPQLNNLTQLATLLGVRRDAGMSLEKQMDQAAVVYMDLLEGKDTPVAGSTYKLLKDELIRLLNYKYFNNLPPPPNRTADLLLSSPSQITIKSKPKENVKEFFSKLYLSDGQAAPNHNWKEDSQAMMSREPPDSWEMEFPDKPSSPRTAVDKPCKGAATFIPKVVQITSKKQLAERKQRKEKKAIGKQKSQTIEINIPVELFNSPSPLPKNPTLRRQHVEDLMTKIHGSFSFMQDSLLDGENSMTNGTPRKKTRPSGTLSPLAHEGLGNPLEVLPKTMHSTPLKEHKVCLTKGDQNLQSDLDLSSKNLNHEFPQLADRRFSSPPLFRRESNTPSLENKSSHCPDPEKHSPCNGRRSCTSTPPQAETFSNSPTRRTHTSPEFQHIQSVTTALSQNGKLLYKPNTAVFSGPSYSTASTQTPPEFAPPDDESPLENNNTVRNGGQIFLSPGQSGLGLRRPGQSHYTRGSVRGMARGGKGLAQTFHSSWWRQGGSYSPQAHLRDPGQFLYAARELGYQHRRGGETPNSSDAWSVSSQASLPHLQGTFAIMDSAHRDSISVSAVEVPATPRNHSPSALLPMHLYQPLRVAFTASRTANFAPGNLDQPIVFDQLHCNLGEMYDTHIGRFTCPVNGTYIFTFHILKLAVNIPLYVNLMCNEEVMVSAYANDGAPDHETASNQAILPLFQGDHVWLRLHRGAIYGSTWKYSTFSGFLLYQD
ncbi:caprin-2 isoform X2 [Kryptolebias marmoratus]|uniref:caprin-2 isoform X2 n=1 Tax=Kryptolebias marmoratus TaxID=37003 RepID=UPI0007F87932|nr:caprin-2 isoform X2 [Kryptolebias marmoratus]